MTRNAARVARPPARMAARTIGKPLVAPMRNALMTAAIGKPRTARMAYTSSTKPLVANAVGGARKTRRYRRRS
jgi:hypothetical protein